MREREGVVGCSKCVVTCRMCVQDLSQELDMAACELDTYLSNLKAEIDNILADDEHAAMFNKGGEVRTSLLLGGCRLVCHCEVSSTTQSIDFVNVVLLSVG